MYDFRLGCPHLNEAENRLNRDAARTEHPIIRESNAKGMMKTSKITYTEC